jgi:hypothetical protein
MHSTNVTASILATLEKIKEHSGYLTDNYLYLRTYMHHACGNPYYQMPEPITAIFNALPGTAEREKMSIVVSEPGVYLVPNISTNSDGAFNYVFFPEKGKFSLVRIYKFMRSAVGQSWKGVGLSIDRVPGYLEHPRVIKGDKTTTNNNSDLTAIMNLELPRVLPYGIDDVAALKKDKVFKAIQRKIKALDILKKTAKKKAPVAAKTVVADATVDPYAKYMVFEGRYIPLVVNLGTSDSSNYYNQAAYVMSYVGNNGKLIKTSTEILPNVPGSKSLATGLASLISTVPQINGWAPPTQNKDYRGWYKQFLNILFYDVTTSSVVVAPELSEQAHAALLAASEAETVSYSPEITGLLKNESGNAFLNRVNKYMHSRGFVNFVITKATPIWFRDAAENQNWVKGDHAHYLGSFKPSFNIEVQYDGKPLIGSNANGYDNRGHLIAEADEKGRIVMVQSAWCQRVAKWTKQHAIDQKNRDWLLDDWLAGPNAERLGMKIKEAPIVFYGNKGKKTDRKAAILRKMRQMQNNL